MIQFLLKTVTMIFKSSTFNHTLFKSSSALVGKSGGFWFSAFPQNITFSYTCMYKECVLSLRWFGSTHTMQHRVTCIDITHIVHQTSNMYISYMYYWLNITIRFIYYMMTQSKQQQACWWTLPNKQKKNSYVRTYRDIHYGDKQHGHCIIRPCLGQSTHTK